MQRTGHRWNNALKKQEVEEGGFGDEFMTPDRQAATLLPLLSAGYTQDDIRELIAVPERVRNVLMAAGFSDMVHYREQVGARWDRMMIAWNKESARA